MSALAPHLPGLLTAWGIMALGLLSPGPNSLAVIATAMERGRREGLALAVGVTIGSFAWATLAVTGLAALLSVWTGLLAAVKLLGAAYLLWLAWGMARAAASPRDARTDAVRAGGLAGYVRRGVVVQMTNPKALVFWIALGTLTASGEAPAAVSVLLVAGCGSLALLGYSAYALVFSTRPALAVYARIRRPVQGALSGVFAFAAWRVATEPT